MEAFSRTPLSSLPEPYRSQLQPLNDNWEQWGREFEAYQLSEGRTPREGQRFSWREGIYSALRDVLKAATDGHCTFCDADFIAATSKETIEHYYPKEQYPLEAYQYTFLYYCCDQCQSRSNSARPFVETLRPDAEGYLFSKYFYYNPLDGELKVFENLPEEDRNRADKFLLRYGINDPDGVRAQLRMRTFEGVIDRFHSRGEIGERSDWPYRFVFDAAKDSLED